MTSLTPNIIRGARGLLDWTQHELAKRADLSQTGIARIENGTNQISSKTQYKIIKAFENAGVIIISSKEMTGFLMLRKDEK